MRLRFVILAFAVAAAFPAALPAAKSAVKTISAKLTPGAVTPKSKAKVAATGAIVVKLDAKAGKACWAISVQKGAGKLLSAHVHRGVPGKNGPVVLPLGDVWKRNGCVFAPSKTIAAVAASPKAYYVDVHTTKFVDGLVRGQLRTGA
jgi:hypothetical protein